MTKKISVLILSILLIILFNLNIHANCDSLAAKSNDDLMASTLEEDKIEAAASPLKAGQFADKWYEKGDKDSAFKFEKMFLAARYPHSVERKERTMWGIAMDIGSRKEFSRDDFDPEKKWYDRGEMAFAAEIGLEYAPRIVDQIWRKRGNEDLLLQLIPDYDMDKSSFSRDVFEVENLRPNVGIIDKIDKIADKWYNKDDYAAAFYFDLMYLLYNPGMLDAVVRKWIDRDEQNIAMGLKPYTKVPLVNTRIKQYYKLVSNGDRIRAQKYLNELLEYWTNQDDDSFKKDIESKLKFALETNSEYYYDLMINKIRNKSGGDLITAYGNFLKSIPLSPENRDLSITDYLTHRAYITQEFLTKHDISIDEARMMLEVDLYELIKKNDIIFSVLHIVALHAKEDPNYKLTVFSENPLSEIQGEEGLYNAKTGVYTIGPSLRSVSIRSALAHEWTHQAMDILFHNDTRPYASNDEIAKAEWIKAMDTILKTFVETGNPWYFARGTSPYHQAVRVFQAVKSYDVVQREAEVIARFVELIASGVADDSQVKEGLKPLYDYWAKFIEPTIQKYIAVRSAIDTFVSDWERENVLDPFYRAQIEERNKKKAEIELEKQKKEQMEWEIEMAREKKAMIERAAKELIERLGPDEAAQKLVLFRTEFLNMSEEDKMFADELERQLNELKK